MGIRTLFISSAAALLAGCFAVVPVQAQGAYKPAEARYVAGVDPLVGATVFWGSRVQVSPACVREVSGGVGGACFAVPPGASTVRVEVADVTGRPVSGRVRFIDRPGSFIDFPGTAFCRRSAVTVPEGAVAVLVALDPVTYGCWATSAAPTTGTVRASFG